MMRYRWATDIEVDAEQTNPGTYPGAILVIGGGTPDDPWVDMALPVDTPKNIGT